MDFNYIQDYSISKIPLANVTYDNKGIPLYKTKERNFVYHPTVVIQYALANYELKDIDLKYSIEFEALCNWLINNLSKVPETNFRSWAIPIGLDFPMIKPNWFSALTHAQGLSCLIRYYFLNKEEKILKLIENLIEPMMVGQSEGGFLYIKDGSYFWEELKDIHILNGCLSALYSLIEVNIYLHNKDLDGLITKVADTIENWFPLYDTGYWSKYSLGIKGNISEMHYHHLHIKQLHKIGTILKRTSFMEQSRKWLIYSNKEKNIIAWLFNRTYFRVYNKIIRFF
jgi:hypothetical protein